MKLRILTLTSLLFLANGAWAATACLPGTLSTLVAQGECAIGNLNFNFLTASYYHGLPGSTPADSSGIWFEPVVGAGVQGFTLTGPFAALVGEGVADSSYGRITYNVSGAANLDVTTFLGDPRVEANPDSNCRYGVGYCYTSASAMSGIGLLSGATTYAALSQAHGTGQPASNLSTPAGWLAIGPFTSTDTWVAHAGINMQVNTGGANDDGSASAYLASATFLFREVPVDAVPEPGTWLLMSAACVPLLWRRAQRAK